MAAKRCSTCGIDYPTYESICRVCDDELSYFSNVDPDPNWRQLSDDAKKEAEGGDYSLRTPIPVPNCLRCDVVEYEERLWIAHQHLLREGYALIEPFQVVQVKGRFYELQGHVGKHAKNMPGGAWWVEEIDPDAEAKHLLGKIPVLSKREYEALEERRAAR